MYAFAPVHQRQTVVRVDNLTIDLERQRVLIGENCVKLEYQEYQFLALLAEWQGRCVTWEMFNLRVQDGKPRSSKIFHVYAHAVREKFVEMPNAMRYIETVRGQGYRLRYSTPRTKTVGT